MNIVVKALKCELSKVEKRLGKVVAVMDANPIARIIELKEEAQRILEENKGDYQKVAKLILPLEKEEKEMFALSQKQIGMELVNKRVDLESDKHDLINAIYYAERE
jgi:hypothetical protein